MIAPQPVPAVRPPAISLRRTWTAPAVKELPKLTALTLASPIGGGGTTTGGGSTVFGLLLAIGLLAGCSANDVAGPSVPATPGVAAVVQCVGDVAERAVTCVLPPAAPGPEIIGGQGVRVVFRSSNVAYDAGSGLFTFDVTLQNLSDQVLGWNDSEGTGIRVFFESPPVATGGTGTIGILGDSIGTFTAAGQSYYVATFDSLVQFETTAPSTWTFNVPGTVTTFAFSVLVSADVPAQGGVLRWSEVVDRTRFRWTGIAATDENDIMVVGRQGRAMRWNGTAWQQLPRSTLWGFYATAPLGDGSYLAVGEAGVVFRSNGAIWDQVYKEPSANDLLAIWVRDTAMWIAVGREGSIVIYNDGVVTQNYTVFSDALVSVTGTAGGTEFAVVNEVNRLMRLNAVGGTIYNEFVDGVGGEVLYDASGALLWSYLDGNTMDGIVRRGNDTIYQVPFEHPADLIPLSATKVAIGIHSFDTGLDHIATLDYGAFPITTLMPVSGTLGHEIRQMVVASADQSQFLITETLWDPDLYRWTGAAWEGEQGATGGADPDLWGVGDTAWIVDGSGTVQRIEDGETSDLLPLAGSRRIWGFSPTELYVADDTALWRGDGSSAWIHETTLSSGNTVRDVWGDAASETILIIGTNGELRSRTDGVWSTATIPQELNAVWGCSGTDAVIGTQQGQLWRWDGVSATQDAAYGAAIPALAIRGVGGSSCSALWVATFGGGAHWNGSSWATLGSLPQLRVVAPADSSTAYLLSGSGFYDFLVQGSNPSVRMRMPTQDRPASAAWVLDNGELLVAGAGYVLRGLR